MVPRRLGKHGRVSITGQVDNLLDTCFRRDAGSWDPACEGASSCYPKSAPRMSDESWGPGS